MTITERHRIAQELHDGIAQDLVGIGYSLDLLLAQNDSSNESRLALRTLRFTVTGLIEKVREEIFQLRRQNDTELSSRIQKAAEEICPGLNVHLSLDAFPTSSNLDLAHQIERISVEVLRNIAAHSQASSVWITLICQAGVADLIIRDDGIGGLVERKDHYGLSGIRERAESVDAIMNFDSAHNGTQVHLKVSFL